MESTLNLENIKGIYQENCFVYHITGSTYFRTIFRAMYISKIYISNFERNSKNPICIRVNTFAESVHFQISQRKKLNSLYGKVNFSVIHLTHVTIYCF